MEESSTIYSASMIDTLYTTQRYNVTLPQTSSDIYALMGHTPPTIYGPLTNMRAPTVHPS